jgi:hypothetical protein
MDALTAAFTPSGFVQDEREASRVELVAIASELAVVTHLIDQELISFSAETGAMEIHLSCLEHRRAALALLSRSATFDDPPVTKEAFRTRLRDARYLRDRLKNMLRSSAKRAPVRGAAAVAT